MKFPKHECGLYLEHNDCRNGYQTVAEYLCRDSEDAEPTFQSDEHRQRCIDTNEIWELRWYPHTPVGFCWIAAPTLEELLAFAETYGGGGDGG